MRPMLGKHATHRVCAGRERPDETNQRTICREGRRDAIPIKNEPPPRLGIGEKSRIASHRYQVGRLSILARPMPDDSVMGAGACARNRPPTATVSPTALQKDRPVIAPVRTPTVRDCPPSQS
jgi:hypothetical protein